MREPVVEYHAVLEETKRAIREAQKTIKLNLNRLQVRPEETSEHFTRVSQRSGSSSRKELLQIDREAELSAKKILQKKFGQAVQVIGEESLIQFDGWGKGKIGVIVDMIDGTDFLEEFLDIWSSAALIVDLDSLRILGAVVGLSSGEMYYASHDDPRAYVQLEDKSYVVFGPSGRTALREARIACYAQKAKNFNTLVCNHGFVSMMKRIEDDQDSPFRFQGFAGNPALAKLCDQVRRSDGHPTTAGIDAVFDARGQQLHDVLPGAFIAIKGGAHMYKLDGVEWTLEELGNLVRKPGERIQYVIAGTSELALELVAVLNQKKFGSQPPPAARPFKHRRVDARQLSLLPLVAGAR